MIARLNPTPRQIRTGLDLLTAAVVISVAFALAGLTWRIAGHAGTGAVTVPSGRSAPAAAADIAPALALAPFGKGTMSDATQPTALPLVLLGIVAAEPASLSTAFIAVGGKPALPFHIGENAGGAAIQGILRDRVILSNAGRIEYLGFPDPAAKPVPASRPVTPGPTPPPPGPAAVTPPANPAPSISGLLQRFNATPSDGGYRIGANPPPGLTAGDVILSLNGTPLTDPSTAGAAFTGAQASGSATVLILRDGKRLTLTLPMR